jgi:hypothetical protein
VFSLGFVVLAASRAESPLRVAGRTEGTGRRDVRAGGFTGRLVPPLPSGPVGRRAIDCFGNRRSRSKPSETCSQTHGYKTQVVSSWYDRHLLARPPRPATSRPFSLVLAYLSPSLFLSWSKFVARLPVSSPGGRGVTTMESPFPSKVQAAALSGGAVERMSIWAGIVIVPR